VRPRLGRLKKKKNWGYQLLCNHGKKKRITGCTGTKNWGAERELSGQLVGVFALSNSGNVKLIGCPWGKKSQKRKGVGGINSEFFSAHGGKLSNIWKLERGGRVNPEKGKPQSRVTICLSLRKILYRKAAGRKKI